MHPVMLSEGDTTLHKLGDLHATLPQPHVAHPCLGSELKIPLPSLVTDFEFLVPGAILTELGTASKEEAIRRMVACLASCGAIPATEQDSIANAVLQREDLGTTGVGRGLAIPHTKHAAVHRVTGALAASQPGIDFASLDGRAVHLIVLLISPPGRPREHLLALEAISRRLLQQDYRSWRSSLRHAGD